MPTIVITEEAVPIVEDMVVDTMTEDIITPVMSSVLLLSVLLLALRLIRLLKTNNIYIITIHSTLFKGGTIDHFLLTSRHKHKKISQLVHYYMIYLL